MQTMNISLPKRLKDFVDNQVHGGGYSSASEYVRELIRNEAKRHEQSKLETLLLEGVRSGESTAMTSKDWQEIRREARKRMEKRGPE